MTRALLLAWCLKAAASSVVVPALVDKDRDVSAICDHLATLTEANPLPGESDISSMSIAVSVGAVEGALVEKQIGDCKIPHPAKDGKWHPCTWDRIPQSFTPWQISLPGISRTAEGYTSRDLLDDIEKAARVAYRLIAKSFVEGAKEPRSDRLASYARGDAKSAKGRELSQYRMWIADRLLMAVQP